jgi:hypothetical protein
MTDARRLYPFRGNLEDAMREILEGKPAEASPGIVGNAGDFLELQNIACHDHEGRIVEQYDVLQVKKDVERDESGSPILLTPYAAISHFEEQKNGLFLPSLRLSYAILVRLYECKDANSEARAVLDQYRNVPGQTVLTNNDWGWHVTNTVVDWKGKNIIHYPEDTDFPNNGGNNNVNSGKSNKMRIGTTFSSEELKTRLQDTRHKALIQDLTGLKNPEILMDISEYFTKTARIWTPGTQNYTSGAWVGCYDDNFYIYVSNSLNGSAAVRGVRRQ